RFPNKNTQAHFCLETLVMFHVEHSQTEDASKNLFFGISEVQQLAPKEQTCDSECRDRELAHWHDILY
ncbi:MAG: hypothetical protein IKD78_14145, partial [Bacteroidales bacterium]|nr:hypothetical protein [Bacteroidales bacterium]